MDLGDLVVVLATDRRRRQRKALLAMAFLRMQFAHPKPSTRRIRDVLSGPLEVSELPDSWFPKLSRFSRGDFARLLEAYKVPHRMRISKCIDFYIPMMLCMESQSMYSTYIDVR